jgi:hypothetical protein
MTDTEITKALRLLTQPRPIPITQLAVRTLLSREPVYQARAGRLTERVGVLLSDVLRELDLTSVM